MVDLREFMDIECENIHDYFDDKPSDSYSQQILDPTWISEQILLLFTKWTTGITKTILRQDIINEARTSRSKQHVKPDSNHHPVLHGTIQNVDIIKPPKFSPQTSSSCVIHIKQEGYNLIILAAIHGALMPYVGRFITGGRKIHFANIRFANDCLIPNQLCVIDLKRTRDDIEFVKRSQIIPLSRISEGNIPESLLLRVESPTKNGIMMSDGNGSIELFLEDERKSLKQLLNFGDIILVMNPWAQQLDSGQITLIFGPSTVIFRVPATVESKMSQVSQRAATILTQDGLSFRNSASCRAVNGTVISIVNRFENSIENEASRWTSSTLTIKCQNEEKRIININGASETPYEVLRVVASLKPNHYVWLFGLINNELDELSFTSETTVYNTSLLYSLIASNIVTPMTLNICHNFCTFVARAAIVEVLECDVKYRHKVCNTLLRSNRNIVCPICQTRINNSRDIDKDFFIKLSIDDASSDPLTVYANGSKFASWGIKTCEWEKADINKRNKWMFSFIGKEFVFVISRACEQEFCGFADDYSVWRVDQCIRPVGDLEREVKKLMKWHKKLDVEQSSQAMF